MTVSGLIVVLGMHSHASIHINILHAKVSSVSNVQETEITQICGVGILATFKGLTFWFPESTYHLHMKHIWLPDNHHTCGYRSPGLTPKHTFYSSSATHVRQGPAATQHHCKVTSSSSVCFLFLLTPVHKSTVQILPNCLSLCFNPLWLYEASTYFSDSWFITVPLSHHLLRKICIFFQRALPSKFRCHQLLKTPTQFVIGCLVPCVSVQVLAFAVNPHPVKPRGRQRLCGLCDLPVGISRLYPTASAY